LQWQGLNNKAIQRCVDCRAWVSPLKPPGSRPSVRSGGHASAGVARPRAAERADVSL